MENDLIREYKTLDVDYNVQCAVENLKTAYWINDSEKFAKVFTDAVETIVSAICHYGYSVCKQPQGEWIEDDNHNIVCPFCGGVRRDCRIDHINFCNRCGAKMTNSAISLSFERQFIG